MKFYDEAQAARKIRRQARFLTFAILFIMASGFCFATIPDLRNQLPEFVKDWFKQEKTEEVESIRKDRA